MKKLVLPTLFFYICTFSYPLQARAAIPLAIIAASAVGAAIVSSTTGAYYVKNGVPPQYVSDIVNGVASAADKLFQPSYLAYGPVALVTAASFPNQLSVFLCKETAIGATVGNIANFIGSEAGSAYSAVKSWIDSHTSASGIVPGTSLANFTVGAVFEADNASKFQVVSLPYKNYADPTYTHNVWLAAASPKFELNPWGGCYISGGWLMYCHTDEPRPGYPNMITTYELQVAATSNGTTLNPTAGSIDYQALKDDYKTAPPPGVVTEIPDILKNMPGSQIIKADSVPADGQAVQQAPTLTQADIQSALAQNSADVAQKVLEAAQAIAAQNPDDVAAQVAVNQAAADAAKAQEEANTQPEEETFSPISATPFQQAYNPGEFDIPVRFSSFLDNVKSSGLFSFSSSFFNSLPGGGSSVYTINGGTTFGTHTIDLSDTLSGGLAVLKTILLACFGFLSIRAVIMKR